MTEKKNPWMQFLKNVGWFIVLFGLIVITMMSLVAFKVINTPMGLGDAIVVLALDLALIMLAEHIRNEWRLSK